MTTIADALQGATDAVNGAAAQYLAASGALNNEIGTLASTAGLDPTQNVGSRILRAVRSGQIEFNADKSTTPGLIAITPATPHTKILPGMPLTVVLNQRIVGATTISVSGLPSIPVRYPGNGELQVYDYLAGDVVQLIADNAGATFQVVTPIRNAVIDTTIVFKVNGANADFPDLIAAFNWVNRRRISATGYVTFQLQVGVNAQRFVYTQNVVVSHPDGARIAIKGQPLTQTPPAGASLSFTGTSSTQRATDTAVNLSLMRTIYQTEIFFQGPSGFVGGSALGLMSDLLITCDGANSGGMHGLSWTGGACGVDNVAVFGAGGSGFNSSNGGSFVVYSTSYAVGCNQFGWSQAPGGSLIVAPAAQGVAHSNNSQGFITQGGLIAGTTASGAPVFSRGNNSDGISVTGGRITLLAGSTSTSNVGSGLVAGLASAAQVQSLVASNNGGHGIYAVEAFIDATNSSGTGNTGYGYLATDGGNLKRPGGTVTGSLGNSPTIGSTGNNNAFIS